jgi:hypothetical protein
VCWRGLGRVGARGPSTASAVALMACSARGGVSSRSFRPPAIHTLFCASASSARHRGAKGRPRGVGFPQGGAALGVKSRRGAESQIPRAPRCTLPSPRGVPLPFGSPGARARIADRRNRSV